MKKKRFLVIGDIMLDEFIYGYVDRISPEAPVPILDRSHVVTSLGGAANAAKNLKELGCKVYLCGIVGKDKKGRKLLNILKKEGIGCEGIVQTYNQDTITKTRFVTRDHHMLRVDREYGSPIHPTTYATLRSHIWRLIKKVDGIVISDYDKGVVSKYIMDSVVSSTNKKQKVFVDPKGLDFDKYKGVNAITPNTGELKLAYPMTGRKWNVDVAAKQLIENLDVEAILVTQGERGMLLYEQGTDPVRIEGEKKKVRDVTGSGDIVIAVFAAMMMEVCGYYTAATIANEEAGKAVGRQGTSCVVKEELCNE